MESFPSDFHEANMFPKLENAFNNMGGSSSVGDTSDCPQPTRTPRRHQHSENLELDRHVQQNGKIPISIAQRGDKPISPHVTRYSTTINVLTRDTFPIHYLSGLMFLQSTSRSSVAYRQQSRINKAPRVKQPYNHSSKSNSFLQRQHKLIKQQGYPVNHVKLFKETHVNRSGQYVSQATADAHNQMLELQSQRTPKGSQPLSEDRICRPFWVGDRATQKLLVGASSPSPERVLLPVLPLHMNKRCTIERLAN
ncbi:CACTA en-spm transposon protein [Cucumis melo var. makuwa]|uniref:CACTA en-spm transposon protein n=1 Tax=Cucumis melo var. makuwa TaxID=1194695 RepID=A0A5A7UJ01_CUCMM|nr:CACTA en-spm transposon protein [Cucumis melo var. makuwa]